MVATAERIGPLRVLVHAAGITRPAKPLEAIDPDEWDQVLRTNLTSTFNICRAAIPALRRAGGGSIILVSSRAGRSPFASRGVSPVATKAHYAASKAGVISITRSLALELAADNIRVNCVAPGPVRTSIMPEQALPAAAASVPLGRVARPEEVASVVRFLCSPGASYMTGAIVDVNGAQVLY
jgi:3-oxoacyl-[acyl-carrier protein] reductase